MKVGTSRGYTAQRLYPSTILALKLRCGLAFLWMCECSGTVWCGGELSMLTDWRRRYARSDDVKMLQYAVKDRSMIEMSGRDS